MPDVEKVIKGLECCMAENDKAWPECESCPYNDSHDSCTSMRPMFKDAIALLKAQEAVAPVRNKDGVYHCGNCGETCVGYEVEFTRRIQKVETYCHKCGRAVKWR